MQRDIYIFIGDGAVEAARLESDAFPVDAELVLVSTNRDTIKNCQDWARAATARRTVIELKKSWAVDPAWWSGSRAVPEALAAFRFDDADAYAAEADEGSGSRAGAAMRAISSAASINGTVGPLEAAVDSVVRRNVAAQSTAEPQTVRLTFVASVYRYSGSAVVAIIAALFAKVAKRYGLNAHFTANLILATRSITQAPADQDRSIDGRISTLVELTLAEEFGIPVGVDLMLPRGFFERIIEVGPPPATYGLIRDEAHARHALALAVAAICSGPSSERIRSGDPVQRNATHRINPGTGLRHRFGGLGVIEVLYERKLAEAFLASYIAAHVNPPTNHA